MNILITGADGFIGSRIVDTLKKTNNRLFLCVSKNSSKKNIENIFIIWRGRLKCSKFLDITKNIDIVLHCAGLAHNVYSSKLKSTYKDINETLTYELGCAAIKNNVKKFIFLSTAGIHSDSIEPGNLISEAKCVSPKSPYTLSKLNAENLLFKIYKNSCESLIILRPPAVYGENVKGNLKYLLFFIERGIPLPFGGLKNNKRSYISIENLVEIILVCINSKKKIKSSFLVANNEKYSTTELILFLGDKYKKRVILFNLPLKILYFLSYIFNKTSHYERLTNSFELDTTAFKKTFNWKEKNK